jgi:hypothetical protein
MCTNPPVKPTRLTAFARPSEHSRTLLTEAEFAKIQVENERPTTRVRLRYIYMPRIQLLSTD